MHESLVSAVRGAISSYEKDCFFSFCLLILRINVPFVNKHKSKCNILLLLILCAIIRIIISFWRLGVKTEELLKLSPGELVDMGICPTCFNRENNGVLYGDNSDKILYNDSDIECFLVGNPRADGHMCISTIEHYHDMSEAPDWLNEKIVRFAKKFMKIICDVYKCERVYLCTMCDGPNNHYHVQLIPRYAHEKRGSSNFIKARGVYKYDEEKVNSIRRQIDEYASKEEK